MKKTYRLIASISILCINGICIGQNHTLDSKQWLLEMSTNDIGTVRTIMNFEFQDSTFSAHSRKNADRTVLGFWTSSLGRIFTDDFKNGSLLHIVKGKHQINNDTTILSGIFTSAMGSYYFNGAIINGQLEAELTNRSKEIKGVIRGSSTIPNLPLEDYNSIYKEAANIVASKLFDPHIMQGKDWKKFNKKMEKISSKIEDDLEMVFGFFYYGSKLPFSHFALMKISDEESIDTSYEYEPQVFLDELSLNTAYMKIQSFSGTAHEMDSVMNIVKKRDYKNLIVDMRDNSGGSVAAGLTFTANVVDTSFYGGVFLTQKWFMEHKEIPKIEDYSQFPHFSQANFDLIIEGIHNEKGLCLFVIPNATVYSGKVFILTNKNTASTCEPIVYGLKQHGQAIIVGETSAGAMLNGEIFKLNSGFSLVVPTATYYTSDGFKIDSKGVTPTYETKSEEALDFVLKNLIKD